MENNKRVRNIIVLDKFEIWKNLAKLIDKRSGYGNSDNDPNNSVAINYKPSNSAVFSKLQAHHHYLRAGHGCE
jgi:hypothetical protein